MIRTTSLLVGPILVASIASARDPVTQADMSLRLSTPMVQILNSRPMPRRLRFPLTAIGGEMFRGGALSLLWQPTTPKAALKGIPFLIFSFPVMAIGIPVDLLSAPFKWERQGDFLTSGVLLNLDGSPAAERNLSLEISDLGPDGLSRYSCAASTESDAKGNIKLVPKCRYRDGSRFVAIFSSAKREVAYYSLNRTVDGYDGELLERPNYGWKGRARD